ISDARRENTVPGTFRGRSDGAGLTYLRRVAQVFNVQVAAGIDVQVVSKSGWRFEGDTITVFPNGKFVYDNEGTRVWDLASREKAAREYLNYIATELIAKGSLTEARKALTELAAKYKETSVAREAEERLKQPKLQLGMEKSPDGTYILR